MLSTGQYHSLLPLPYLPSIVYLQPSGPAPLSNLCLHRTPVLATLCKPPVCIVCAYTFCVVVSPLQIHCITDNIRCCGAGTAADTEPTTTLISSELPALSTGRKLRIVTAMTMLEQMLFRCVPSAIFSGVVYSSLTLTSRRHLRGAGTGWRGRSWPSTEHHAPSRLNRQAPLRDNGFR